jgi:hypothetical protein
MGAGFVAASWPFWKQLDRSWWLLLAYAIGTHVAVQLPGRRHAHYYQLWLPVAVIGAAWGAAALAGVLARSGKPGTRVRVVQHAICLLALIQLGIGEVPNFFLPADRWSSLKHGPQFVEVEKLASEIDELLLPGETFYDAFDNMGLYFKTRQHPPTGVFFFIPLFEGPFVEPLSKRVIADLEAAPPELIVCRNDWPLEDLWKRPVPSWWLSRYRLLPGNPRRGLSLLYVRRGGALERRLEAKAASTADRDARKQQPPSSLPNPPFRG